MGHVMGLTKREALYVAWQAAVTCVGCNINEEAHCKVEEGIEGYELTSEDKQRLDAACEHVENVLWRKRPSTSHGIIDRLEKRLGKEVGNEES